MATEPQSVFYVGYNGYGELGVNHTQNVQELTQIPNKLVNKVISSNAYSIWSDDEYKNIFATGYNIEGQCAIGSFSRNVKTFQPIKYFQENNIKINKIFINLAGKCTFFITDQGQLYGCGSNAKQQLGLGLTDSSNRYSVPQLISQLSNVIDIKSCFQCNIALCSTDNTKILQILSNWSRIYIFNTK